MNIKTTNINFWYKKTVNGTEYNLVKSFINNYKDIFYDSLYNVSIFNEPHVKNNFPDIVIVFWDKTKFSHWKPERNNLEKRDIKILHHMSLKKKRYKIEDLEQNLGYTLRDLEQTIQRLLDADLLQQFKNSFRTKHLDDIFFIKSIISIEVKIKNWKDAFFQASLNEWFSSETYVLLPKVNFKSKVKNFADNFYAGLLEHDGEKINMLKKSQKRKIPASYCSWLFNENIGRHLYQGINI